MGEEHKKSRRRVPQCFESALPMFLGGLFSKLLILGIDGNLKTPRLAPTEFQSV